MFRKKVWIGNYNMNIYEVGWCLKKKKPCKMKVCLLDTVTFLYATNNIV